MAASQAGQEAIYLRALLRGFNFRQVGATEIWEDNASCIMMSENPANRESTRHVDTRVHYLRDQYQATTGVLVILNGNRHSIHALALLPQYH